MQKLGIPAILLEGLGILVLLAGCRANTSPENGPSYSGTTAVSVTIFVNNFEDWLKAYKEYSDSDARINLYVSPDDPNLVTYYELTKSHADAKEFFSSGVMKRNMKRAGVMDEPTITYFDLKYRNQLKSDKKYRVLVTHDVADYDAWKKVFDAGEQRRTENGFELRGIYVDSENPNMVGVFLATNDPEKTKVMIESESFKKILKEADVASKPTLTILKVP